MRDKPRYAANEMKRLLLLGVAIALVVKFTERGQRAKKVYIEEVSSGAKPIQAVGTSIAAFVGLTPTTTP